MTREFTIEKAIRQSVPLLVGLMGPSGGGKTYSALRLARGIQRVFPGDIIGIDTEANRMLHYASMFDFHHIPFGEPFGSGDYLEVLRFAASKRPSVIIVDSMSHEHEGPGGLLDLHEHELDRIAGDDWKKRDRMKMLAWSKPKSERRKLINGLLQMNANFIFCFRAKESSRPVKKPDGKIEVENFGFVPIAGDEFVFEMTINALLLPHANGIPTWVSDAKGERMMMKLPEQFREIFERGDVQLDESIGERLAVWAKGDHPATKPASHPTTNANIGPSGGRTADAITKLENLLKAERLAGDDIKRANDMVGWLKKKGDAAIENSEGWQKVQALIESVKSQSTEPEAEQPVIF